MLFTKVHAKVHATFALAPASQNKMSDYIELFPAGLLQV